MTTADSPVSFPFAGICPRTALPSWPDYEPRRCWRGSGCRTVNPNGRALDLTRPSAVAHIAFGYGPHHCVGAALARLELQIALSTLLARFPTLRLAVPAAELRWRPGMLMRTLEALPVTW